MRRVLCGLGAAAAVVALWGCTSRPAPADAAPAGSTEPSSSQGVSQAGPIQAGADAEAATPEFYTSRVRPIFQANCFRCHAGMNHRGGLSMATHAALMRGGRNGQAVVPGDPGASLMVKLIRHEGRSKKPGPMPPDRRISDADVATVERWVRAGAVMPADPPLP